MLQWRQWFRGRVEIDALGCKLYGLMKEEIGVVIEAYYGGWPIE